MVFRDTDLEQFKISQDTISLSLYSGPRHNPLNPKVSSGFTGFNVFCVMYIFSLVPRYRWVISSQTLIRADQNFSGHHFLLFIFRSQALLSIQKFLHHLQGLNVFFVMYIFSFQVVCVQLIYLISLHEVSHDSMLCAFSLSRQSCKATSQMGVYEISFKSWFSSAAGFSVSSD